MPTIFRRVCISLLLIPLVGCDEQRPHQVEPVPDLPTIGEAFDPRATGTVRGEVVWHGPLLEVVPFTSRPKLESPSADCTIYPNPNAPLVDGPSRGVGNAVVYLRSVDLKRSRSWDHAGVFVRLSENQLRLEQGHETVRVAFARRGEVLTMKSTEERLDVLRAGGATFFSLTFAEPNKPRQRRLERRGRVELSSAAGQFWQRAYMFVDDHPYYARTDAQGRFILPNVPEGAYRVVCWIPNWKVKERERDTETGVVRFVTFAPPLEQEQRVNVRPGGEPALHFRVEEKMFSP